MCGVTGYLNLKGESTSRDIVGSMTDAISHRGPDNAGIWTQGSVALGHRRLSIIDLRDAGNQPMVSKDKRYILSYNGEVYNYRAIRKELAAFKYEFKTQTDTEVVLQSFAHWHLDSLSRFNGMFAFALWDSVNQQLYLVRDRYGIKPLYYYEGNNVFAFGSEIKALLAHPEISAAMDKEGLLEYFTFQNFFTDRTLFQGIKLLPGGCFLQLDLRTTQSKIVRYWDYEFQEPTVKRSDKEYIEELDHLFTQAVSRQLVSDVEVSSYLSGGMDSGSITALAAKEIPYIRTFTCGFDLNSASGIELNYDERATAEMMSYEFKTEHYEMVLKAGDMERSMSKLVYHLEEPRVGQSYPNYYIAQLASKFSKVVLAGTGGDEFFGGYPWRYYQGLGNKNFNDYIDKYYTYWQRLLPGREYESVFSPIWSDISHFRTRDIFKNIYPAHFSENTAAEDYINHSLYMEAKTFLQGLLIVEDKLSMAHGLETRVPFLDNDLVDFAMKLPAHLKVKNIPSRGDATSDFQHTSDGKLILRNMMKKYIPHSITEAKKQGFSAPDGSWFQGESMEYIKQSLFSKNARIYQFMNRSEVEKLVSEHMEGKINRRLLIWSLLSVEAWCQQWLIA